jgi:hypothetical protein
MWRKEIAKKRATRYPIAPVYAEGTHRHLDSRAFASIVAQVNNAPLGSEYALARKRCKEGIEDGTRQLRPREYHTE